MNTKKAQILREIQRLAESRANDAVRLAFLDEEELGALEGLDLSALTEFKRNKNGTVDVIVSTHEGAPGEELLEEIQDYFDQRREIAVDVLVKAPETDPVDVTASVEVAGGWDGTAVTAAVRKAVRDFFSGERLSGPILVAQINQLIFTTPGVANCAVTAPAADVPAVAGTLPTLGTLTVEVAE